MKRTPSAGAAALLLLVVTACYSGDQTADQSRNQAGSDLACSSLIDVHEVHRYTVYKDDHVYIDYRASGCEKSALYHCKYVESPFGASNSECELGSVTTTRSTVTVNGQPFVPDGDDLCAPIGTDFGVDLKSPTGEALRVVRTAELVDEVVFTTKDGVRSPPFQSCAVVHFDDDKGRSGTATLSCTTANWALQGTVAFEGC